MAETLAMDYTKSFIEEAVKETYNDDVIPEWEGVGKSPATWLRKQNLFLNCNVCKSMAAS